MTDLRTAAQQALDPMVDRLWSQMNYAHTVGNGHSGHLNNAAHTARMLSQELRRLHHNNQVLKNALWRACGDDEEAVNATIASEGELK